MRIVLVRISRKKYCQITLIHIRHMLLAFRSQPTNMYPVTLPLHSRSNHRVLEVKSIDKGVCLSVIDIKFHKFQRNACQWRSVQAE